MTNPDQEKWTIIRSRYIPCFWPLITYFDWPIRNWIKVNHGTDIHIYNKGHLTAVFNTEERKIPSKIILDEIKSSNLTKLRNKGIKEGKEVVRQLEILSKKSEKADVNGFITIFNEINSVYPKLMRYNMLYWLWTSKLLEQEIQNNLNNYTEEEKAEIFQNLSQPTIASYSKKIENELNILIEKANKQGLTSNKTKKDVKLFSRKYFWFPYEYVGPGIWDEEAIIKLINEHPITSDKTYNIKNKQKEIIRKYKISKENQKLFKIMQTLTLMQDDRKMFHSHASYYINGVIIKNLAEKIGIKWQEALYIEQDLLKLYLKDKREFSKILDERNDLCITEHKDNYKRIYQGEEARIFIEKNGIALWTENKDIKEIKGQSANKGIYRGRVRILKTSHIEHFNKGDIIVTGMTTPDFAPLMKKAGAIITDEGGITSHASIVSRELNIPCIIGTKVATKLLKDGDLVEVDANKGIVTKL